MASHFGQAAMVRFVLGAGAGVDSSTQAGYTPLHQAAQQGQTVVINLLLENKAKPNAVTNVSEFQFIFVHLTQHKISKLRRSIGGMDNFQAVF